MFDFDNHYARLPARMFALQDPTPVAEPRLFALNPALCTELGLRAEGLSDQDWAEALSGNRLPSGAEPLAQAYAGHQFGNWVPQLGDGRAVLLGQHKAPSGTGYDIQLKGAGRTPYSRGGDGRAWLGPVMREYLISEAMHALGVPTTRALAIVTTGESVWREGALPGAVLTRVAESHLRVGTFQYFIARRDLEALQALVDLAITTHYPAAEGALGLLEAAVAAQAELIAQWMSLGFIHGVMNTDNCHIGGLTLDYGPCAFMDTYDPQKVFSSIDRQGRYAYASQPQIAVWNLAQLGSSMLPLIDADEDRAITLATEALDRFKPLYQAAWIRRFGAKLGLAEPREDDRALIERFLSLVAARQADFTQSFRALSEGTLAPQWAGDVAAEQWLADWHARVASEGRSVAEAQDLARQVNPAIIPRNHQVEYAIAAAVAGDRAPFDRLQSALSTPYEAAPDSPLRAAPKPEQVVRQTFCGT